VDVAITLRFTGRWVFARDGATGIVYAVAPRYAAPFRRHLPLMSVEHEDVKFKAAGVLVTTKDPMARPDRGTGSKPKNPNVSNHQLEGTDTQLMTWDLTGARVHYAFRSDRSTLPGTALERGQLDISLLAASLTPGAVFDRSVLTPAARSTAVVEIRGAHGRHTQMVDDREIELRRRDDPTAPPLPVPGRFIPADLVEFDLPAQDDVTLLFDDADGGGAVVVKDGGTVTFAHMCAAIRRDLGAVDHEFSQYYTLLTPTPPLDRVLIPVEPDRKDPHFLAAEGGDCDCVGYVEAF
jgi:hypothetical protein